MKMSDPVLVAIVSKVAAVPAPVAVSLSSPPAVTCEPLLVLVSLTVWLNCFWMPRLRLTLPSWPAASLKLLALLVVLYKSVRLR